MTVPRAWVLLHGTPLDSDVWSGLSPILVEQQPVFAPVATPSVDDHHPQLAVAERLAVQLPHVAERWDIVGHSFGGQIAIELALVAPDRVATLSLICTRDTPFLPFAQTATDLRSGTPIDVEGALQRWFRPEERQSSSRLVSYARERLTNADRYIWATALDAIATYDRSAVVHLIQAPTMLICAQLDPVSDPTAMSALADRLPNAELQVLSAAAHLSPLMQPAFLAARLRHQQSGP
ncbi:alpha/beta fold hydrolase [Jatrophihabitans sp. DSM 45814]